MQKSKEEMAQEYTNENGPYPNVDYHAKTLRNFRDGYDAGYSAAQDEIKLLRAKEKLLADFVTRISMGNFSYNDIETEATEIFMNYEALTLETIGE